MKFIRYSKFKGFDVSGLSLGDLMELLQDSLLSSGFDDDYYWTRQRQDPDTSLDALRQALLQALLEMGELSERDVEEMPAENNGQFKGSQLEELLNQLIERLVEEGYLKLQEEQAEAERQRRRGQGRGEVGQPPRHAAPLDRRRGFAVAEALRVRRHDQPRREHDAALGHQARGADRPFETRILRPARPPAGLPVFVRHGRHARLLALDEPLRRGPLHAGQEGRARARAPDPHAVPGRLPEGRALPRRRRGVAARAPRDDAGR